MTSGQDLSNLSMLDLFRMEVETQVGILNNALLAIETNSQPTEALQSLMRAAHSIKGAARIVNLNTAVKLAHEMEECFVAAQAGKITLVADQIDVLLQAVDWLLQMAQVAETELDRWLANNSGAIENLISAMAAILHQPQVKIQPSSELIATPTPAKVQQQQQQQPSPDRAVRVSTDNFHRLMGLAGESLVEANRLQTFADSLLKLRSQQAKLSQILNGLQESLALQPLNQRSEGYLNAARQQASVCRQMLGDHLNELEMFTSRSTNLSDRLYREVIASHMRPFADGVQAFPRMVRDLARELGKQVKFEIVGSATKVDRDILDKLEAPLTHMLRNAIDHGIESPSDRLAAGKPAVGLIKLEAMHKSGMLSITVSDDGRGIDWQQLRQKIVSKQLVSADMINQLTEAELIEFLFLPGFSTGDTVTEISGRGVGLDIVHSMVQQVGGVLRAVSQPGIGISFHLQLPLTLSVIRVLLVEIAKEPYAFPLTRIEQVVMVERSTICVSENRQYFRLNGQHIGLVAADQVLELDEATSNLDLLATIIISDRLSRYGLVVNRFLGERDLVVRPLDPRLGKVKNISAAGLLEDGSPVLVVDVEDMARAIEHLLESGKLSKISRTVEDVPSKPKKRVLVVDDSITVREMERKLLQNKGYAVEVAVNGMDGWNAVRTSQFDLIITDIDMPRMNGIELVRQLKNHPSLKNLPVIVVSYKDREEDRIQGLEAGANYYLTKSSFHDNTFSQAVFDLIGGATA